MKIHSKSSPPFLPLNKSLYRLIVLILLSYAQVMCAAPKSAQAVNTNPGQAQQNLLITATLIDSLTTPGVCHGTSDGSIYFIVDAGGQSFTASNGWVIQGDTVFHIALSPGNYSTFIQSTSGDTITLAYTIDDYPVAITTTNLATSRLSDCGYNDRGYVTEFISGGTPPYTLDPLGDIEFSLFGDSIFATGLMFAHMGYSTHIIDSNGCSTLVVVGVAESDFICGGPGPSTLLCAGIDGTEVDFPYLVDAIGENFLLFIDGLPNPSIYYGYPWHEVQFFNVMPGSYTVTLTDNIRCQYHFHFTVGQSTLQMSSSVTNTTCIGCTNGEIALNVSGYNSYYSVTLDSSSNVTGDTISNLPAGIYDVCITDSLNCTLCDSITILEDPLALHAVSAENTSIYPNPINSIGTINTSLLSQFNEVEMVNSAGEKVPFHYHREGTQLIFDTSKLGNGIYFIHLNEENKLQKSYKFIVTH